MSKYVDNYDDGSNPPENNIGCGTVAIIIVCAIICLTMVVQCNKSFNDFDEGSQYEYSLID